MAFRLAIWYSNSLGQCESHPPRGDGWGPRIMSRKMELQKKTMFGTSTTNIPFLLLGRIVLQFHNVYDEIPGFPMDSARFSGTRWRCRDFGVRSRFYQSTMNFFFARKYINLDLWIELSLRGFPAFCWETPEKNIGETNFLQIHPSLPPFTNHDA